MLWVSMADKMSDWQTVMNHAASEPQHSKRLDFGGLNSAILTVLDLNGRTTFPV